MDKKKLGETPWGLFPLSDGYYVTYKLIILPSILFMFIEMFTILV